jgi:hypothetical protein
MGETITGNSATCDSKAFERNGRINASLKIRVEEKSPMPFFCNEDLSLHYVERGQGEPLVLDPRHSHSGACAFAHGQHRRRPFIGS